MQTSIYLDNASRLTRYALDRGNVGALKATPDPACVPNEEPVSGNEKPATDGASSFMGVIDLDGDTCRSRSGSATYSEGIPVSILRIR